MATRSIILFRKYFFYRSETFIEKQVQFLKNKYRIFLVSPGFSKEEHCDYKGVTKIQLGRVEKAFSKFLFKFKAGKLQDFIAFYHGFTLSRLIRREKIGLIHAHFGTDAVRILPYAKRNKVPLVVTFYGIDASGSLRREYYKRQLPHVFNYASKIILLSKHMVDTLQLQPWAHKVVILPCGTDPDEFRPLQRSRTNDDVWLLHSGRIVGKKGVIDLIDVFARLHNKQKNIRLRVLGDGAELAMCKQKVAELSLNHVVTFLGAQPHEVVKNELNEADIFVLNSRTDAKGDMEGTPVTLLEAMSMCKAVVSTRHAGIPDVIKDNVNGRLVDEKNNDALETAIDDLIKNREKRMNLGKEARNTIIKAYSNKVLFQKLDTKYG